MDAPSLSALFADKLLPAVDLHALIAEVQRRHRTALCAGATPTPPMPMQPEEGVEGIEKHSVGGASFGAEAGGLKTTAHHSLPHRSPAMRIYRHALEAILGMLTLGDLSQILAVSREWVAAVSSMKPINAVMERSEWGSDRERDAFCPLPPIASMVGSPLLRHLAAIQFSRHAILCVSLTPLDNVSLGLLAQHAPSLTSLWCTLTLTSNEPLIFPAKLASLELRLDGKYTDAEINSVLTTVAALPSLSRLHLGLEAFDRKSSLDLSLLAACRSLSDLKLASWSGSAPYLRHPSGTDPFVARTSVSLRPRMCELPRARAVSAAASDCAMAGHRTSVCGRVHWKAVSQAAVADKP